MFDTNEDFGFPLLQQKMKSDECIYYIKQIVVT